MPFLLRRWVLILAACSALPHILHGALDAEQMARGERLYLDKCAMCHHVTGQGVPPVYPPLAESDWLLADRARAIKVLCEGLQGQITVKGQVYHNVMPAQMLDDQQVADTLTYVVNSWGNMSAAFTANEVEKVRESTRFKTYDELVKATAYPPLPAAPKGWKLREVVQLPEFCTRFAGNGTGTGVYLLTEKGGVYHLDPATGALTQTITSGDYEGLASGDFVTMGMTQDAEGRLWIVSNQRVVPPGDGDIQNSVVIHRTTAMKDGHPVKPEPWFRTRYPYGIGPYNHGVSHLAFGPDGMLYVNSGSRTDGGERGENPRFYKDGEVEITACLWRLDPRAEKPKIEVYARGIRNAYGFDWDAEGRLFTISNGPDANTPEEMDFVQPGRHYGFPFQFGAMPAREGDPYPHTPSAPRGLEFQMPVANLGPAGGGKPEGLHTLDAHSSPGGMIWCGEDVPEPFRNRFLIPRFGNLLGAPAAPEDVGFDLLSAKLQQRPDRKWEARVETVLAPLGRPIDVIRHGDRVLILEYTRPTNFKDGLGWLPGRVLELSPAEP